MHVTDQPFQLFFGAVRSEMCDLRLEGDHQVMRGVDDVGAEIEDAVRVVLPGSREFRRIGIEADTEQRLIERFGTCQLVDKTHAVS